MKLLKEVFKEFSNDNCTTLAASLAYYTLFALPPLLYLLVIMLTFGLSISFEDDEAERHARSMIETQIAQILGNQSVTDEVSTILNATKRVEGQWWRWGLSFAGILIGATGAVAALQSALNQVWQVRVDPRKPGVWPVVRQRIISLGMILVLGFLLVISLVVSSLVNSASTLVENYLSVRGTIAISFDYILQAVVIFFLFGAILRYMPDAQVRWRDVGAGAATTTVLFFLGRLLLHLYFSNIKPGAELGAAAGSLVALLLWVYYSSLILLLGAEITQVVAVTYGNGVIPKPYAVHVEQRICEKK